MSDKGDPKGPRRPAPRRPPRSGESRRPAPRSAAPPPADDDEDEKTQALNIADLGGMLGQRGAAAAPADDDEDEKTQALNIADLGGMLGQQSAAAAPDDGDDDERTVAMQVPQEFLGGGGRAPKRTVMGHPAMKAPSAAADDADEATMAMNVDAMLSQIDDGGGDADEATMAMNVDDMLSQIDDGGGGEASEDEATMAVNMDDMLAEIDGGISEDEATMAVSLDELVSEIDKAPPADDDEEEERTVALDADVAAEMSEMMRKRAAAAQAAAAAKEAPVPAVADVRVAAPAASAVPQTSAGGGFFGSMGYALAYEGNASRIESALAELDAEEAAGGGRSAAEINQLRQKYSAAREALDPDAAKQGWIMFGAFTGGLTVLILVLGLVF